MGSSILSATGFTAPPIQDEPPPIAAHALIVAEVGINHNGDVDLARRLIDMAHRCGCDAVKFQKRSVELVYTADFLDSPRQSPWGTTNREQKHGLELDEEAYEQIDAHCRGLGLPWFASAWDVPSQLFLRRFDVPYNKIASPMLGHLELLEAVAQEQKRTFISTGMSTLGDIDAAVAIFRRHHCPFVLMHAISEYPAPETSLNLSMLPVLRTRFNCQVGYSGHEMGTLTCVLAAMLGATVIERHITLDRTMYGSDQMASLEEPELRQMVAQVRALPTLMGSGAKCITPAEAVVAAKLRYYAPADAARP